MSTLEEQLDELRTAWRQFARAVLAVFVADARRVRRWWERRR